MAERSSKIMKWEDREQCRGRKSADEDCRRRRRCWAGKWASQYKARACNKYYTHIGLSHILHALEYMVNNLRGDKGSSESSLSCMKSTALDSHFRRALHIARRADSLLIARASSDWANWVGFGFGSTLSTEGINVPRSPKTRLFDLPTRARLRFG